MVILLQQILGQQPQEGRAECLVQPGPAVGCTAAERFPVTCRKVRLEEPVHRQDQKKQAGAEGKSKPKAATMFANHALGTMRPLQDIDTWVSGLRIKRRKCYASLECSVNKTKDEKWGWR